MAASAYILVALVAFATSSHCLVLDLGPAVDADPYDSLNPISVHRLEGVNLSQILEAEQITFPHGETYQLNDVPPSSQDPAIVNLDLVSTSDGDFEADLTIDLDEVVVVGRVAASNGSVYLIREALDEEGGHVWVEVELEDDDGQDDYVIPGEDEGDRLLTPEQEAEALSRALDRQSGTAWISVKVYYTRELLASMGNSRTNVIRTINNLMCMTNQGYMNSRVSIRVYLHCAELFTRSEASAPGNNAMLNAFAAYKGSVRNLLGTADMAMLLTVGRSYTGIAYVRTTSMPIGMARLSLSLSQFTFGHEIGHILGGEHNREEGNRHPYAHGYMLPGTRDRTIMSYNSDGVHTNRINYHSSSFNRDNFGRRLGASNIDNSRHFNERRFLYPPIGNQSQRC